MKLKLLGAVCAVAVIASVVCIPSFAGDRPAEDFTNIAPLSGAVTALNSQGVVDGNGALQVNIPVAYTPGSGYFGASVSLGGHPTNMNDWDNGSGVLSAGFGENKMKLFISGMQLNGQLDTKKVISGQVSLVEETDTMPAFSFGVQDATEARPHSRSYYGVATKGLMFGDQKVYASLGYGEGRFLKKMFAGLSAPIGGKLNLATEWDGYQLNTAVAFRPGGPDGKITFLGGYNGHTGVLAGVGTTFNLSSLGF